MLLTKVKTVIALTFVAAVTVAGLGLLAREAADLPQPPNQNAAQTKSEINVAPPLSLAARGPNKWSIFAVGDANELKVWAYDLTSKTWHSYKALKGTRISGLGSRNIATMSVKGDQITEIAAFCTKVGKWSRQTLSEPANGAIDPYVTNEYAIYTIGRDVYAFSSITGTWSRQVVSEPPRRENPPFISNDDCAVYTIDRHVYAFSAPKGTWTTLDLEEGSRAAARMGPSGSAIVSGAGRLYSFVPQTASFQEIESHDD